MHATFFITFLFVCLLNDPPESSADKIEDPGHINYKDISKIFFALPKVNEQCGQNDSAPNFLDVCLFEGKPCYQGMSICYPSNLEKSNTTFNGIQPKYGNVKGFLNLPNQPYYSNPIAFDCARVAREHGIWFPGAKWHGIGLRTVLTSELGLNIEIMLSYTDKNKSEKYEVFQRDFEASGDYCVRIQLGNSNSAFASLVDTSNTNMERIKINIGKIHSGVRNWHQLTDQNDIGFWLLPIDWTMAHGVRWFAFARADSTCAFYIPQYEDPPISRLAHTVEASTELYDDEEEHDCSVRWMLAAPGNLSDYLYSFDDGQYTEMEESIERVVRVGFLKKPRETKPKRYTKLQQSVEMKIGSWAKDHGYILKLLKSKQRLFNETADFDYAHVPKRWNNVEVQLHSCGNNISFVSKARSARRNGVPNFDWSKDFDPWEKCCMKFQGLSKVEYHGKNITKKWEKHPSWPRELHFHQPVKVGIDWQNTSKMSWKMEELLALRYKFALSPAKRYFYVNTEPSKHDVLPFLDAYFFMPESYAFKPFAEHDVKAYYDLPESIRELWDSEKVLNTTVIIQARILYWINTDKFGHIIQVRQYRIECGTCREGWRNKTAWFKLYIPRLAAVQLWPDEVTRMTYRNLINQFVVDGIPSSYLEKKQVVGYEESMWFT